MKLSLKRREVLIFLVVNLILIGLLWKILASRQINTGDFLHFFYENFEFAFSQIRKGEFPLWNPYTLMGHPIHASMQFGFFYPMNILFIFLDTQTAIVANIYLHALIAFYSMYFLLRSMNYATLSSFVGGVVYLLGSFLSYRFLAGHYTIILSYAWIPWIFLTFRMSQKLQSYTKALLSGFFLGVQFLAGSPQFVYLTLVIIFLYYLAKRLEYIHSHGMKVSHHLKSLKIFFVMGVCALLVGSVQLIPSLVMLVNSTRSGGVDFSFATNFSYPPENLLTFLSPNILGDIKNSQYFGRWNVWESSLYIGIFPLCFWITSIYSKSKRVYFYALMAALGVFLAFGRYNLFYSYFFEVNPFAKMFRAPGRFLLLTSFAVPVVVASVLEMLSKSSPSSRDWLKATRNVMGGLFLTVLIFYLAIFFQQAEFSLFWRTILSMLANLDGGERINRTLNSAQYLKETFVASKEAIQTTLIYFSCGFVFLYFYLRRPFKRYSHRVAFSIGVMIIFDLFLSSRKLFYSDDIQYNSYSKAIIHQMDVKNEKLPARIVSKLRFSEALLPGVAKLSWVGGYDPTILKRTREFFNLMMGFDPSSQLVVANPYHSNKLLLSTAVSHFVVSDEYRFNQSSLKRISDQDGIGVYKVENPTPRYYLTSHYRVVPNIDRRFELIKRGEDTPLILEKELEGLVPFKGEIGSVQASDFSLHEIKMDIKAEREGILVLKEAYYPLWEAFIKGKKISVFPVNHIYRGVRIPKGDYSLVFKYDKTPFYLGLILSSLTVLLIFVLLIYKREKLLT